MNLEDVILRDTRANQPAANLVPEGTLFYVTDESVTERSNGSAWQDYSDGGSSGITQLTGDVTAGPGSGSQAATIANDAVTDAKLRNSSALSVIGRSANSTGDPADIAASVDGQVLRRSGTTLGFGEVATAGIADAAVTKAKIENVAADKLLGRGNGGGAGAPQEITLGTGLSMSGTTLNGSAAAGALVLLSTQTASASASLDFTSLITSTYDEYMIEILNLVPATDNVEPLLEVSTDNGSNYITSGVYTYAGIIVRQAVTSGVGGTGQTAMRISGGGTLGNGAGPGGFSGSFRLYNPLSTSQRKMLNGYGSFRAFDTNSYHVSIACWFETEASDVDAFRVRFNSGNITSGIVRLYGIAKT